MILSGCVHIERQVLQRCEELQQIQVILNHIWVVCGTDVLLPILGAREVNIQPSLPQYGQMGDVSTHSIIYDLLLKCPIVKWFFCGLRIRISFHLAKLLVMDKILCNTAFPSSLAFLMNDGFHVGVCSWVTDYQLLTLVFIVCCIVSFQPLMVAF